MRGDVWVVRVTPAPGQSSTASKNPNSSMITAAWLAHVDERRTIVQKVGVQDPVRTHTQNDLGECSLPG